MADLNKKLIDYGGLEHFRDLLLNDSGTTSGSTWSSSKINSGLTLLDEKIDNAKPIEEVSELPNASENKDKFYRLSSDDNVYVSELKSRTTITTNILPDEQQIDKAYLYINDDEPFYYKGAWKIICTDGEIDGYGWLETYPDSDDWFFVLTKDNAVNVTENSECTPSIISYEEAEIDEVNKTVTIDNVKANHDFNGVTLSGQELFPIPATYNAPESAQIGNATFTDNYQGYKAKYSGEEVSYNGSTWYKWIINDVGYYITNKKASEIYGNFEEYWMSDVHIVYFDGDDYIETESYSGVYTIYIPQLNAPDSEQVDNAYISEDYMGGNAVYTGEETTIEVNGSDITVYIWLNNELPNIPFYSTKPAYQIYNTDKDSDDVDFYIEDTGGIHELTFSDGDLLSISTVKYQRTETTEEWDWEKVATEQYVDNAIAEIPQLESGENVSIENGKISAIGYKAGNSIASSFAELPEIVTEPYMDMTSQIPSTDLYFTGEAGATQYEVSGQLVAMIGNMVGIAAFQVGYGNIAKIIGFDSDNNIVTLDKSLDDNNALSAAQLSKFYLVIEVQISGDANVKTYSYVDSTGDAFHSLTNVDTKVKIGDYALRTVTDITSNSITFDETLDAENAVSNAKWMYTINVNNNASGIASHAEGNGTIASGNYSHAEGDYSEASGEGSHAEGGSLSPVYKTLASGQSSHAEGGGTVASGVRSHAEGSYTLAQNYAEHAEGKNNRSHKANTTWGNTIHSIGIGGNQTPESRGNGTNALEIMQNGDMYVKGVGNYQGTDTKVQDNTIKTLQDVIASLEARIAALENPSA